MRWEEVVEALFRYPCSQRWHSIILGFQYFVDKTPSHNFSIFLILKRNIII